MDVCDSSSKDFTIVIIRSKVYIQFSYMEKKLFSTTEKNFAIDLMQEEEIHGKEVQ